jgi:Arc/MetJ-type ribon-helix-helix transcriptional regulator
MEIDIPEDLKDFVDEMMAERQYNSESKIVMAGLRLLKAKLRQDDFPSEKPKEKL